MNNGGIDIDGIDIDGIDIDGMTGVDCVTVVPIFI
jgi:hypothetical protein